MPSLRRCAITQSAPMMNVRIVWLVMVVSGPVLAQSVYVGSLSDLYQLNLNTCQTTLIGRMPTLMNDIALTPSNVLYGVSGNYGNPALAQTFFRIDQTTGLGTNLGRLDYTINGLVAGLDGTLYGAGASGEIVTIEPTTGTTTLLGNCGYSCLGDLTFYQRRLYMTAIGNRLVEINLQNPAQSRLIGTLAIRDDVLGLATVGSETCQTNNLKLYGTAGSGLYEIDPLTASVKPVCTYGLASIDGVATAPTAPVGNLPNAGLDSTVQVCADRRSITLTPYLRGADSGGLWRMARGNGKLTGSVYTPAATEIQSVRLNYIVTNGLCTDTAIVILNRQALPRVTLFTVIPTGCSHTDGELLITADGLQPLSFALDSTAQGTSNTRFTNLSLQTYTVYLTDRLGCRAKDTVTITNHCTGFVYLPTAFSPNGDQHNDTFVAQLSENTVFVERFVLVDRWGKLVFNRDEFVLHSGDSLWDGLNNGTAVTSGLFSYQLQVRYASGVRHTFLGSLSVLR